MSQFPGVKFCCLNEYKGNNPVIVALGEGMNLQSFVLFCRQQTADIWYYTGTESHTTWFRVSCNETQVLPWIVVLIWASNNSYGVFPYYCYCKLTCVGFQEKTVINLSLWLLAPVSYAHLSQIHLLLMLNNLSVLMEACSHHCCSYGINYDRLSLINELIPIIWSAFDVCASMCAFVIH